ncbi:MAG: helix-turn-helix transcriptional regulator [Chitinophagaceae bacterium]
MIYYTIPAPPSLAGYIRFFWVLEGNASGEMPYVHRSMADGCAELLFHYKGVFDELLPQGGRKASFISGISAPSRQFRRFIIDRPFAMFGAWLYPFAITRLFNIPVAAISNTMPDLHSLLGQEGRELEEQMMLAADNTIRVQLLTAFLEKKLHTGTVKQPAIFSSISYLLQTRGQVSVNELAGRSFLSIRQFERNFKQFAGFSPKLYTRIIRFQAAMQQYGNRRTSLTDIAYQCGYYDQSHFIHDFKEFSGHHPRHYFSGKAEGTEWKEA